MTEEELAAVIAALQLLRASAPNASVENELISAWRRAARVESVESGV